MGIHIVLERPQQIDHGVRLRIDQNPAARRESEMVLDRHHETDDRVLFHEAIIII
ncbi:hypothetical protein D3C71_1727980 [compost metagenome]